MVISQVSREKKYKRRWACRLGMKDGFHSSRNGGNLWLFVQDARNVLGRAAHRFAGPRRGDDCRRLWTSEIQAGQLIVEHGVG